MRIHMGITRMHRGITITHSGAARRRIVNPIHAALEKGLGDRPSQFLFGLFALLLVRSSFARLSTFLYVCILLLLFCSFYNLRSLIGTFFRVGGFPSILRLVVSLVLGFAVHTVSLLLLPSRGLPFVPSCILFCFSSFLRFLVGLLSFCWTISSFLLGHGAVFLKGFSLPIGFLHFRFGSSLFIFYACWDSLPCVLRLLLFLASLGYVPAFFWFPSFVTRSNLSTFATGSSLRAEYPLSVVSCLLSHGFASCPLLLVSFLFCSVFSHSFSSLCWFPSPLSGLP